MPTGGSGERRSCCENRACNRPIFSITALRSGFLILERTRQRGFQSSCQQLVDDLPLDVGQPKIAALKPEREFFVIEAEQVQDGRVEIVDVDAVFDGVEAEFVGLAEDGAGA